MKLLQLSRICFLASMLLLTGISIRAQSKKDSIRYYLSQTRNTGLALDSVSYYFDKAKKNANGRALIDVSRREALSLLNNGEYARAIELHLSILKQTKDNSYIVLEGLAYFDLSNYYYYVNKPNFSYEFLLKSKNVLENVSDADIAIYNKESVNDKFFTKDDLIESVLFNIASIAHDNGDYDKAEEYYLKSLNFFKKKNNTQGVIDAHENLANLLVSRKQYKKAITAYKMLLSDFELEEIDKSLVYYNLAISNFELKENEKALVYINKAIGISEKLGEELQLIDLYFIKAEIESELGNQEYAIELLKNILQKVKKIDDYAFQEDIYGMLAKSEERRNNYKQASMWFGKMIVVKDSISKINENSSYNKISLEDTVTQQGLAIENEKKLSKKLIWTIILGILLLAVGVYAFVISKKNSYRKLQLTKQEVELKEIKLENIRIQEETETKRMQEELIAKKRELMLSLMQSRKRKVKIEKIIKEFSKLENNSIINKVDVFKLKEFILEQALDMETKEEIQNSLMNIHKDFFTELLNDYPKLSKTEIRVLAFIKLGLNTKEIADAQFVSIDAVRKTRHRIRKKIVLEKGISLEKFILKY